MFTKLYEHINGVKERNLMKLENRIALVTGSSRGLGRDAAMRLAEQGCDVIITYQRDSASADSAVAEIVGMGRRAVPLCLDVGDIGSLDAFATTVRDTLAEKWGRQDFDFLVNNAGIIANEPIAETTEETFDALLGVHFKGVYFLTQKLLPLLADGGRVVNLSSGLARFAFPGYAAYGCMKSAIEAFTRYLAKEVGERGITVNTVAPGPVETDLNRDRFEESPEMVEMLSSLTALGRIGQPEDIGGVIAFLCTEEAGWISGQRIELSGGMLL
jgi:NAD(P)-dependent dehydrogenase (short-subunit alcohol dehydrogenase family)